MKEMTAQMQDRQVTRRTILGCAAANILARGAGGVGAAVACPSVVRAGGNSRFSMAGLHDQVSQKVSKLAGSRDVTLTVLYPQGSIANVKTVGTRFEKMTGVTLRYQEAPLDDINSKILLAKLGRDSGFDVALPATFGIPDLAQADAIRNLDGFAEQYEPEQFQPTSLYSLGDYYKGSLYGYQTDGDAYTMFYNKDFLENPDEQKRYSDTFGRELAVPATWKELDESIGFFNRPDQGVHGGSLFRTAGYLPWEWWIRFHSKGYFPLGDTMDPQINNEAGIEALEDLKAVSSHLDPRTRTDGLFDNWKSFSGGKSFCNIGWGGSQKYFHKPGSGVRGRLAYGPTPGGVVGDKAIQTPYFNWGWNYVVSANSKQPEIAYLFILFACSPVISTEAVRQADGYFDPYRSEHYADAGIIETYSKEFLDTHKFSMANAIPDLYLDGQGEYFGTLRENIAAALTGKMSSKEAMDRTARTWRLTTFRLGKQSQLEQWTFLKSQYPLNLQAVLK